MVTSVQGRMLAALFLYKKVEVTVYTLLPDLSKNHAFWKVGSLRTCVSLVRATYRWRWAGSTDGIVLTGDDQTTLREICPSANLTSKNLTWCGLGSKPDLFAERPTTNGLRHCGIRSFINEKSRNFYCGKLLMILSTLHFVNFTLIFLLSHVSRQ